jgi:hypothetical protein
MHPTPAFATDPATAAYYDRRAGEYDEWYTGAGLFAVRARPGWHDEVGQLAGELGGEPLFDGAWFVAARASW